MDIKMNIKRAYCPDCHVLVDMHEKKTGETTQMTCCRCDRPIWVQDGLTWKYAKKLTAADKAPSQTREIKIEPRETRPAPRAEVRHEGRPEFRDNRPAGRGPREGRPDSRPPRDNRPGAPRENRPPRQDNRPPAPRQEVKTEPKAEAKPAPKPETKA